MGEELKGIYTVSPLSFWVTQWGFFVLYFWLAVIGVQFDLGKNWPIRSQDLQRLANIFNVV